MNIMEMNAVHLGLYLSLTVFFSHSLLITNDRVYHSVMAFKVYSEVLAMVNLRKLISGSLVIVSFHASFLHAASGVDKALPKSAFKSIEWIDLMPKEELEILSKPPSYIAEIEDGSVEDRISSQIQNALDVATDDPYQQALVSTNVIPEMNGKAIRIPGFIVPIEFDDEQTVTQFFLVPFFGACIHYPPPPPNQIILVNYPKGLKFDALYDPFWISGVLQTSITENELATSAYTMNMQYVENYRE